MSENRTFIYCWNEGKSTESVNDTCVSCGKTLSEIFALAPPEKKSKSEEWWKNYNKRLEEAKKKGKKTQGPSILQGSMDRLKADFKEKSKSSEWLNDYNKRLEEAKKKKEGKK